MLKLMRNRKNKLVNRQGARAGTVLYGTGLSNQGLRLLILEDQERGRDGPLNGRFILLDTGENMHSDSLQELVNQETDADKVLRVIRQDRPACVNVVNRNILIPEAVLLRQW